MRYTYYFCILSIIFTINSVTAQNKKEMAIKKYGSFKSYENPAVIPSKKETYKILYRITKNVEKQGVNKGLWQVARLVNLLKAYDVPNKNIEIVALISGKGFPAIFTNEEHNKRYGKDNPNIDIINELIKHNVSIHICGQTIDDNKIDYKRDINPKVKLTLSAMIDVIEYSKKGFVVFE